MDALIFDDIVFLYTHSTTGFKKVTNGHFRVTKGHFGSHMVKKGHPIEIHLGHFGSFWVKKGHPFVLNLPPIDFEVASYLTSN